MRKLDEDHTAQSLEQLAFMHTGGYRGSARGGRSMRATSRFLPRKGILQGAGQIGRLLSGSSHEETSYYPKLPRVNVAGPMVTSPVSS